MTPFAIIDIGANSIKLLVAAPVAGAMQTLRDELRITRLGEGLHDGGRLSDAPMRRTVAAVSDLLALARYFEAKEVVATGTMALRTASNAAEFTAMLHEATGLEVEALSGEKEAQLSFAGAVRGLAIPGERLLVFDTGGGSTEIVTGGRSGLRSAVSLPLGAAFLTEAFLHFDPPSSDELKRLRCHLRDELAAHLRVGIADRVIGVGGTVTTLAAMQLDLEPYDGDRVHGMSLTRGEIEARLQSLSAMTTLARRQLRGLHPQRAAIIVAGVAVAEAVLELTDLDCLTVSDHGLRHGLWWERFGSDS
ncbi:MAG: Ppx/GppA family phosphatase [Candidatus Cloacimonetes bacterium]|nr:Ppx/GppA family phosphatase [Candidatus Cloacimonadota bacterium]